MSSGERFTEGSRGVKYFFDTYALVEIYEGSPRYADYTESSFFTTMLNLFEFHQYLLRVAGEKVADEDAAKLLPHVAGFGIKIMKQASKFRRRHRGKNLSMTDCIGYAYAKEKGLAFLTGDIMFEGLENVKFAK